jgi:hypothetical protein
LTFCARDLVLLPPDEAAACDKEQDNARDQPIAVGLEEIAELVAPQILIDFADKGFA